MKVHYFYSRKYPGDWYAVSLEAIMEEDVTYSSSGQKGKSFTYIEDLDLFVNKEMDRHHCCRFKIDFGKNAARGSSARTVKELYESKEKESYESWRPITRAQYERIRKLVFAIYEKEKCMNFDLVKGSQKDRITVL